MKRNAWILLLFLLALFACQPTPEKDAVRQKNQSEMIEMAQGTGDHGPVEVHVEAQKPDFRALYDIPERLVESFTGADGRLTVHIHADVKVPDKPMPIVRVHPVDFSQEFVYQL